VRSRLRRAIQIGDRSLMREFSRDEDLARLPASSLNLLATAFKKAGVDTDALRVLKVAQLVHPEDYVVNFNLGLAFRDMQPPHPEDAVRCFQAALAAEPDDQRLQTIVGFQLMASLGDVNQGMALLERAVCAEPGDPEIQRLFGRACSILNDWERAIPAYRERARLTPNVAEAWSDLADQLEFSGNPKEAVPAYREALRLDPKNEDMHASLGYALIDAGDVPGAHAEWEAAKTLGNSTLITLWLGADLHALDGDRELARRAIQKAISVSDPNNFLVMMIVVESLVAFRDPELRDATSAVWAARRLVDLYPKAGRAWFELGYALHLAGDWAGCIAAMERSMQLMAGGNPSQWLPYAMALEHSGRHERALEWRQKALAWMEQRHSKDLLLLFYRDQANALIRD
jgi:tetratricopeptide (TPR) repeat protein